MRQDTAQLQVRRDSLAAVPFVGHGRLLFHLPVGQLV